MAIPQLGIRLSGAIDAARSAELAAAAETHGYSSVWFAENPFERSVLPAMAAAARATSRIGLGVGVWNPYLRHPAQIAMDAAALDELSGGRVSLGIGSGLAAPIRRLGIDNRRPLGALRDTFHIVRRMLSGESVTYAGTVFAVANARLAYRPPRADIPLLMAARGPRVLALCGDIADGLMVSNMVPAAFTARAVAALPTGKRVVQYVPCSVGTDRAQALAALRPVLTGMLRTFWALAQSVPAARASLVDESGIPAADFATAVSEDRLDERFVQAFAVAGTADEAHSRIAAYRAAGVTDLALTFVGADPEADMAYLAAAIEEPEP